MSELPVSMDGTSLVSVYRGDDGRETVAVCQMFQVEDEHGEQRDYINIIASLTEPDSLTVIDQGRLSIEDTE